jgi:transposase-like protein
MSRKDRRVFSDEFKREIVAKAASGEKVSELARLHSLTVNTIYSWRRQLRDKELDQAVDQAPRVKQSGVNPKYVRSLEEKLREANEKLGELYIVVEALKKMGPGSTKSASSYIVTGQPWAQLRRRAK